MWTGLSQFTNALKEQAESVVRESGLDGQLEQARKAAAGLLLDVPAPDEMEQTQEYQGSPRAPVSHFAEYAFPTPSGSDLDSDQPVRDTEDGAVKWHGLDSGGFSDVPLGSPPQRTSQNMSQNGVNPRLEQVAQSLVHLGGPNSAKSGGSSKVHQLQSENASLKERLKAIEIEAVEAFGELEELKDRLAASEAARAAAERRAHEGASQCSSLEAELQRCRSAIQAAQAREEEAKASADAALLANSQLQTAQEAAAKRLAESEAAQEALSQQLRDLQQMAISSPVKQVSAEEEAADGGAPAAEDVKDLKAKLAKIKRQAITFKSKYTDAAAARDAALAELEVIKQGSDVAQKATAPADGSDNITAPEQQLQEMQEMLREAELKCQALREQLQESHAACMSLSSEKADLSDQLARLKAHMECQHAQMAADVTRAQQRDSEMEAQLHALAEAHSAAQERAGGVEARAAQLADDLDGLQQERQALEASLQQQIADASASEAARQDLEAQHSRHIQEAADRLDAAVSELAQVKEERSALQRELELAQQALANTATSAQAASQNGDDRHAAAGNSNGSVADAGAMQSNPLFSPVKGAATAVEEEAAPVKAKAQKAKSAAAKKVAELQSALREKSQDLERVTDELIAARISLANCSAKAEKLASDLAAAREQLQFASASGTYQDAEAQDPSADGVAQETAALQAAIANAAAEHNSLDAQLAEAREEAASEEASQVASSRRCTEEESAESLQQRLEAAEDRASQLAEELEEKQKLLEAANAKLQMLEGALLEGGEQLQSESAAATAARAGAEAASWELVSARKEVAMLQDALHNAQTAHADAEKSDQAAKARLASVQEDVSRLQEVLKAKEEELEAVRGGASVESSLASSALKQAKQRAEEAEQAAVEADGRASQMEQQMEEAAARSNAELVAADSRRREAEAARDALQAELEQAQAEVHALTGALEAERSATSADVASLRHSLEQESQAACSRVREEAEAQWQARLQEHAARSDALLAEKTSALKLAEAEVDRLEKALAEAGAAAQVLSDMRTQTEALERELAETRRQLIDATAHLEALRQEAEGAQAGARERQKKFAMLNATFRKKEEALLARCEDAESAAARLHAEASSAEHRATLAQQEAQRLAAQAEEQSARLAAAEAACAAAERGREDAQSAAASAAAQLVAAQTELASARAAAAAAKADVASFEDRVAAAVTVREEEAAARVRESEAAAAAAHARMAQGEARAAAAEAAKIELSLKLADALSQQDSETDVSAVPTPVTPRPTGTSEEWAVRYEELELAAKVASRRAAAAEAEVHRLKQQLEAADKRAKELAWQIKMISDPRQIGGQQGAAAMTPGVASSVLDMFGCGANYRR
ncbi:g5627 [Coccomyxa elongata]